VVRWIAIGLLIILAVVRYGMWQSAPLELREGMKVRVRMRIGGEIRQAWGRSFWSQSYGNQEVEVEVPQGVEYGDEIWAEGKLEKSVTEADYTKWRLNYTMIKVNKGVGLTGGLRQWREIMIQKMLMWLPGDEGALAAGILLGGSGALSKSGTEAFRKSGLLHIVAASGYNVSVVAGWAMAVGAKIWGRRRVILFVLLCIITYVIVAGAGPAVVRAGIMGGLVWLGMAWGRKGDPGWLLVIASLIMVIIRPIWFTDIGFQLSVAATAGLIWVLPMIRRLKIIRIKSWAWFEEGLWVTVAAQIATLPLLAHYFGQVSAAAPVVNALVLWAVPWSMQLTAAAVGVGMLFPAAGQAIAWLAWPLLRYMTGVVSWSAGWPGAGGVVGKMGWGWVIGYYLVIIMIILKGNLKFK